jgi:hypothetical protein
MCEFAHLAIVLQGESTEFAAGASEKQGFQGRPHFGNVTTQGNGVLSLGWPYFLEEDETGAVAAV